MSKKMVWRELGADEVVQDGDKFSFGPWNEGDAVRLLPDGHWMHFNLEPSGHKVSEFRLIPGGIYEDFRVYRYEKAKKIPVSGNPGWYELPDDAVIKKGDRFIGNKIETVIELIAPRCHRSGGVCRTGRVVSEAKAEWTYEKPVRFCRKRKHNRLLEAKGYRRLSEFEPVKVGDLYTFGSSFDYCKVDRIESMDFIDLSECDWWIGKTLPQIAAYEPCHRDAIVFRKIEGREW